MATTITLKDAYGYDSYKASGLNSTVIDASGGTWIVDNMGSPSNLYPVRVYDSSNVTLIGGTITGRVPLDTDWTEAYVNSAALLGKGTDNFQVRDWKISQAWDAIRVVGSSSDSFVIDSVWLSDIRDDGIENDMGLAGTIRDSLLDGVSVAISLGNPNTAKSNNVVIVDDVLIRMESFLYKGEVVQHTPFKVLDTSPAMKFYNSIIAIEDVNHRSWTTLERAWDKTVDASGNYFLNLSDKLLPANYPRPPDGFTILQGKAARAYWESARSEWIDEHTGGGSAPAASGLGGGVLVTSGLVASYDSADVTLGADNRVTGWSDSSGRGNHLMAAGNPMLLAGATPGVEDAVGFDSVGDLLNRTSALTDFPEGNADRTMFLVVKYIDAKGVASGLSYGDGVQNQAFGLVSNSDDDLMVEGWGSSNDFDSNVGGPAQGWMTQSVVLNDGRFDHFRNGALIGSDRHTFNTDAKRIVIGAEIAGLGGSEMQVSAALIYNRALTEAERMQVEDHLQTNYIDSIL